MILLAVLYVRSYYTSPAGRYDFSKLAATGTSYFEFSDGEVYIVADDYRKKHGDYYFADGKWILKLYPTGEMLHVRPTFTHLRVYHSDGSEDCESTLDRQWLHYPAILKRSLSSK